MQLFTPPPLDPRWYQVDCLHAISREFMDVRSTLAVLATGLGKTVIFALLAAGTKGKVLVLAHRDELVDQAKEALERATRGEYVEREKAQWEAGLDTRLVVGSVQTLCKDKRLHRFPRDHFAYVIVDEGHHGVAPTYRKITDYFASAKVLYVTATADRGDGTAMGLVAESVAYRMDIYDGIQLGYLVPPADGYGRRIHLEEIRLEDLKPTGGDFTDGQLDRRMLEACEGIVKETLRECGDRQTIGFMPGKKTAEYCFHKTNELRADSAIYIHDGTDPNERKRMVRDFKKGRYQFLWNCGIATEGFDPPGASCVVLGRPTKSRARMAQEIGRVTRPEAGLIDGLPFADRPEDAGRRRQAIAKSRKPNMLILDFVGNSGRHELVGPEDILGGNWTPAEKALAKKKAKEGIRSTREALERAREELQRLARAQKATVKSRVELFDPFKLVGIKDMDKYAIGPGHKPMYPSTRAMLLGRPFNYPATLLDKLDRRGGEKLLKVARLRLKKGLATYPQMAFLSDFGINDPTISRTRAGKGLEYIERVRHQNRPVDVKRLNDILYGLREPGEEG